jgi:hypothetical protein
MRFRQLRWEGILLEMEGEIGSSGLRTGTWCGYCVERVLAYNRYYGHSDADGYNVQPQVAC